MGHIVDSRKINRLHERYPRIIYNDKRTFFLDLLEKDNSVYINYQNLYVLAAEMLKVCTKTSPVIMQEIFPTKEERHHNLRVQTVFVISHVKSVN